MKQINKYLRSVRVIGVAILLLLSACEKNEEEGLNVVEVISSDSKLSTLTAAFQKAEITSILEKYNSLTVFAPTNSAFEELFNNLGVRGIDDLSSGFLDSILYYHILFGELTSSLFSNGYVSTLRGGPDMQAVILQIKKSDSTLNRDIHIIDVDRMASNGVIHVIDSVLIPPTVFEIANLNGGFTHFVEAVGITEMDAILNDTGPYTLFAPTDPAFEALFTDMGISGISDLTNEQLTLLIQGHIANGNLRSTDLVPGYLSTLGGDILIDIDRIVTINNSANVIAIDLQCSNGVIHVIDKVLIPAQK